MTIKFNYKYVLAFLALTFIMHEAHEIAHTSVGRLICGCWGQRDFNVWELCTGCSETKPLSILATFTGPIFTYFMIWIGLYLMNQSDKNKALGFSLIFANLPFARILTASLGGGDEVWGLSQLLKSHDWAWVIGLLIILALSIYPLWKAYLLIKNKHKLPIFLLFFFIPIFIDLLVVLGGLNTLLSNGILKQNWILGSPLLVSVWTILVSLIYFISRKNIELLNRK